MLQSKNGTPIPLMFGTGASSCKDYAGLAPVVQAALESGIRGFDTAPSYGTEKILGKCLGDAMAAQGLCREAIFVQTKVDAWQMMAEAGEIRGYVTGIMEQMGLTYLDALLVHWPVPEYLDKTWQVFRQLREAGLVRHIGICNLRLRQLRQVSAWEERPEILQIERNPLRTCQKETAFCREAGMTVQSCSPQSKFRPAIRTSPVQAVMAHRRAKSVGQVVMRWHMDTGAVPIFTSQKPSRVREYAALSDFSLTEQEIGDIDSMNRDYKMYLEACSCPGF